MRGMLGVVMRMMIVVCIVVFKNCVVGWLIGLVGWLLAFLKKYIFMIELLLRVFFIYYNSFMVLV